jgi:FixJ family two-component response regulator
MPSIYIFDYDADITYVLCDWFKSHDYETMSFTSVEQLLKQLNISHPDCIILDCLFGKVSLTSNICHTIQDVFQYNGKIIITSTTNISAKDLKMCNASNFIAKPFSLSELLETVSKPVTNSLERNIVE